MAFYQHGLVWLCLKQKCRLNTYVVRQMTFDVQELIAHGANIEASNVQGATALFSASEEGHLGVVQVNYPLF